MLLKSPLLFYIRMFARSFWIGMGFLVITNLLDGGYPLLIKKALDQVGAGAPWAEVARTALFFFALMSGLAVTRYCWRTFFGTYHTSAAEDLRRRLFRHLTKQDPNFFSKNQIGELMSLLINDIQAFRQAIGTSVLVLVDGMMVMTIIVPIMLSMSPSWTWKTLIFLPIVPICIRILTKLIFERFKIEQEKLSQLSGFTQETVTGIRVLKGFVQEATRMRGYRKINLEYEDACNRMAMLDSLWSPIMEFGVASGSVILIFIVAPDLLSGVATVGTFVAFQRYITKMVWPMTSLGYGISQYQKGMASFARIKSFLVAPSDLPDQGTLELTAFESLEVRHLSYRYHSQTEPILKDVNFKMQKGQRLGIVGSIGSGKSTLAQLLTGLLPVNQGQILINESLIQDYKPQSLHEKILLVTQEPILFSMNIEDNLRMGQTSLTTGQAQDWLEQVQLGNEVRTLPFGLQTELGEKGVNLSGGQKQRLALARGFAVRPDLLILDDTLSAVDSETEKKLILALESWNQTLILISHRLSVIQSCDQILVLNQGRLEAAGNWSQVLEGSAFFRELCRLQEVQS